MMNSKRCPNCSKVATNFSTFFKSISAIECQHCNKKLKLGGKITVVLLVMVVLGLAVPTFFLGVNDIGFNSQLWMTIGTIAGYPAVWYVITSGYRV